MGTGNITGDGKAEAAAGFIHVAGKIQPMEGPEGNLALVFGNARAVVVDGDGDPASVDPAEYFHPVAVFAAVGDQVGEAALHRQAPDLDFGGAFEPGPYIVARDLRFFFEFLQKQRQVGLLDILVAIAAGKGQIILEHVAHLVDILAHRLAFRRAAEERELQSETRQNGPEIVADTCKHGGALLDLPFDAPSHVDEGKACLANFACAAGPKVFHRPAPAEGLRRIGKAHDRADLIAQEQQGDDHQNQRG